MQFHVSTAIYPPNSAPPPLLKAFSEWLEGRPWGCVGAFDLGARPIDETPLPGGWVFYRDVVPIFRLPDGGAIAEWFHDGERKIVGLGSDGDQEVLAKDLRDFLIRVSEKEWASGPWSDLAPLSGEGVEDATAELGQWLGDGHGAPASTDWLRAETEAFQSFLMSRVSAFEAQWSADKDVQELEALLSSYRPRPDVPWSRRIFTVTMVGDRGWFRVLDQGETAIREEDAALTILSRVRERMQSTDTDLGLWWSAVLTLRADGRLHPEFHYMRRPLGAGEDIPIEEFEKDLMLAPRAAAWVPRWLSERF